MVGARPKPNKRNTTTVYPHSYLNKLAFVLLYNLYAVDKKVPKMRVQKEDDFWRVIEIVSVYKRKESSFTESEKERDTLYVQKRVCSLSIFIQ